MYGRISAEYGIDSHATTKCLYCLTSWAYLPGSPPAYAREISPARDRPRARQATPRGRLAQPGALSRSRPGKGLHREGAAPGAGEVHRAGDRRYYRRCEPPETDTARFRSSAPAGKPPWSADTSNSIAIRGSGSLTGPADGVCQGRTCVVRSVPWCPLRHLRPCEVFEKTGGAGRRPVLARSAPTGPSGSASSMDELPHGDAFLLTSFELWTRRAPVRPCGAAHG